MDEEESMWHRRPDSNRQTNRMQILNTGVCEEGYVILYAKPIDALERANSIRQSNPVDAIWAQQGHMNEQKAVGFPGGWPN